MPQRRANQDSATMIPQRGLRRSSWAADVRSKAAGCRASTNSISRGSEDDLSTWHLGALGTHLGCPRAGGCTGYQPGWVPICFITAEKCTSFRPMNQSLKLGVAGLGTVGTGLLQL